jgi:hypothetical protein
MRVWPRLAGAALALILLIVLLAAPGLPLVLAPAERLTNPGFEDGFSAAGVAQGWGSFRAGAAAWRAERREPLLVEGAYAQALIFAAGEDDEGQSDAGLQQTISVSAGRTYQLTIRSLACLEDGHGEAPRGDLRLYWAADMAGGSNWRAVRDWVELPVGRLRACEDPGPANSYVTALIASGPKLTLFLRGRYRPAGETRPITLILDGLSLRDSAPVPEAQIAGFDGPVVSIAMPSFPVAGASVPVKVAAAHAAGLREVRLFDDGVEIGRLAGSAGATLLDGELWWRPAAAGARVLRAEATDFAGRVAQVSQSVTVGDAAELVQNGEFTAGFDADGVARGWQPLGRSEQAMYVPAGATSGQVLRLSDRSGRCLAGIWQAVSGLRPGARYTLRISGRLRPAPAGSTNLALHAAYRFAWSGESRDAEAGWQELPWNVEAQGIQVYYATVTAPAASATLALRIYAPGAAPCAGELEIDSVSLRGPR